MAKVSCGTTAGVSSRTRMVIDRRISDVVDRVKRRFRGITRSEEESEGLVNHEGHEEHEVSFEGPVVRNPFG